MTARHSASRVVPLRSWRPRLRPTSDVCVPGRNCWRRARADRVAFLVDADAYFRAFADTVERAESSIVIVGWDVQASTRLRTDASDGAPATLRDILNAALRRRPRLRAYVLDWNYSLLFALERELMPMIELGWRTHRRLDFRLDDAHPLTASQHQKIVVVDDAVAFVGGMDLTVGRWDTPDHRPGNPLRVGPSGAPHSSVHDVQVAVSGDAARAIGVLARERWRRATGETIRSAVHRNDPWPRALAPDLEDIPVAIARTEPAFGGRRPVSEVETLYVDSIAAARRSIYIENQYVTSVRVGQALAARLREADGPEVVIVCPRTQACWLERRTITALQARVVRSLREADRHDRLRIYFPRASDGDAINVHAKVMVVDDTLVRIGSSNLTNRSMGLDTECDVVVEAAGSPRVAGAFAAFRNRLLAEHLDVAPELVLTTIEREGSIGAAVEELGGNARTLVTLPDPEDAADLPYGAPLADPERPDALTPVVETLPRALRGPLLDSIRGFGQATAGLAVLLVLWATVGGATLLRPLAHASTTADAAMAAATVIGSTARVPLSMLLGPTVLAIGPWPGIAWATTAIFVAALAQWAVGRFAWRSVGRRVARHWAEPVSRRLASRSTGAVALLRLLPVAPFAVVNVVAGAIRVPLPAFLAGVALGSAPLVALLVALAALFGP